MLQNIWLLCCTSMLCILASDIQRGTFSNVIKKILCLCEMLKVGVPMKVDMHWASAAIILKFNGRRLWLVICVTFLSVGYLLLFKVVSQGNYMFRSAVHQQQQQRSLVQSLRFTPASITEQLLWFWAALLWVQLNCHESRTKAGTPANK